MDDMESIEKLEKWTIDQQKHAINAVINIGAGNEEVVELKRLLKDEVCLRKATEDEIHNLSNQLFRFSKMEVWTAGGNSDGSSLQQEEVRYLRSELAQISIEANLVCWFPEFNVPGEIAYNKMNLFGSAEDNSTDSYLLKEYFLFVVSNLVVVSFDPSNGRLVLLMLLRVAEVGSGLFDDSVRRVGGGRGGLELRKQGMEAVYRLNVGGSSIRLWRA
ncbi:hypothetical protein SASPL_130126 [Salvia splendens]|uniref:Uncharacterized protein n=1 Tax=Salvia splendens TaxID=180675 RepID=A0A8X8ZJC4_SALSN|nr:hypothetical protein SASPL_130126 [Salvia splendens]